MAQYVHSGEKIQASQYNALVDAIAGPTNATTDQPFTQTKNGVVVNNGRNTTQTQPDPTTEPLFNISYGVDILPDLFDGGGNYFDGIWAKLTSWDKLDNICYHTYMLGWPVYLFLIDDTASSGKLIWSSGSELASSTGNLLLPLCKVSESAGVATFTIKNESASASLLQQMQTVVVIGNFQKLGCQLGELAIDISKDSLTNLVRSACPLLNEITGLALRDSRPLYVAPDEDFAANAQPVTYKVGQIQCETLPDSFQGPMGWVGYDIHLSSLAFTPSKQIGANNPIIPTFSQGLFNFDRYPSDISTYHDLSSKGLSCYDVLVKHKKKHPYADDNEIYKNQAEADLEYVAVSCLVPPGDTNANKDGAINTGLSSVDLATIDGNAFYELYGFQQNGTLSPSDLSSGVEVVVRDFHSTGGNGARVNYVSLSTITESLSGGTSISGDHNVIPGYSNSIDTKKDSRGTYHQLYGFENPSTRNFYQLMDGKYQFVIRDYNSQDKYVVYSDISSFVNNLVISGDSNLYNAPSRTITYKNQMGQRFYQLYNWQGNNHTPLTAEIKADGQVHYINDVNGNPGPKHFLFEDHQTGELEYHPLGIKIPEIEMSSIGGGDEIIQNVTVISSDLSALSADLSALDNFWVKGESNQENYGSSIGDSSKTQVINLNTKRLNGTWYTDNGDFNVGGTCYANKLETNTVLQIGGTTLTETQLQQLLALLNP